MGISLGEESQGRGLKTVPFALRPGKLPLVILQGYLMAVIMLFHLSCSSNNETTDIIRDSPSK